MGEPHPMPKPMYEFPYEPGATAGVRPSRGRPTAGLASAPSRATEDRVHGSRAHLEPPKIRTTPLEVVE